MKKILTALITLLSFFVLVPACFASSLPSAAPSHTKSTPASSLRSQQKWESIVVAGKKEGTVSIYATAWSASTRTSLTQAFKEKYGIKLEFSPFSRGAALVAKVQTEQRAGMYIPDVFGAGAGTLLTSLKPLGLLGTMEPLLVLPEVADGKYWQGGKFPFLDKGKTTVGMIAAVNRNIMYNTDLIKKGEITAYRDVLKPQYKGKIILNDPTVTGAGKGVFLNLARNIWNLEEAKDYLRKLIKLQEVVVERDNRTQIESVARGKYAIGIGPNTANLAKFIKLGARIDAVLLKEGVLIDSSGGHLAIPLRPVHPNATKVFINWLLSKDGQTVLSTSWGVPSLRNDVPTAEFSQILLPQPGERIFFLSEEDYLFGAHINDMAKQVIDEASK